MANFEQEPHELPLPVNVHHLWVGDDYHGAAWRGPAAEHFEALKAAKFRGEVCVGLVGSPVNRAEAMRMITELWPGWNLLVQAEEGFEMVTLNVMHQWSKRADVPPETPVLYTHGKGSFNNDAANRSWRRVMTSALVGGKGNKAWETCVNALGNNDAVGCHWLTRERYPDKINQPGIFGGNFWWANAGYIAKLPEIGWVSRYCAEGWIGLNDPKVEVLVDGWPSYW